MNNPDHISESFKTIFGVKILKFFLMRILNGKILIRDGKNTDKMAALMLDNAVIFHCSSLQIQNIFVRDAGPVLTTNHEWHNVKIGVRKNFLSL
jgi:hypothetical protein